MFDFNTLQLYSVSKNGQLCIWECDTDLEGLNPVEEAPAAEGSDEDEETEEDKEKNGTPLSGY